MLILVVPLQSRGGIRACGNALHTPDTLVGVNHTHVIVLFVDVTSPRRTYRNAFRLCALMALENGHVIGEMLERIAHDLNSRKARIRYSIMGHRACHHAILAPTAPHAIHDEIAT